MHVEQNFLPLLLGSESHTGLNELFEEAQVAVWGFLSGASGQCLGEGNNQCAAINVPLWQTLLEH